MKSLTFLPVFSILFSCSGTSQEIPTNTKKLPLKEASAVAVSKVSNLIWVAEDSGNKNNIYGLTPEGKIAHAVTLENAKNVDWEDLTADEEGNLYVGDFGNNDNIRKDLCIYKINAGDLKNETAVSPSKVEFYYPEQSQFPPKKSELFMMPNLFYLQRELLHFHQKQKQRI